MLSVTCLELILLENHGPFLLCDWSSNLSSRLYYLLDNPGLQQLPMGTDLLQKPDIMIYTMSLPNTRKSSPTPLPCMTLSGLSQHLDVIIIALFFGG